MEFYNLTTTDIFTVIIGGIIYITTRLIKKGQRRVQGVQDFAGLMNWQCAGKVPYSNLRRTNGFYLFSLADTGNSFSDKFAVKIGTPEYKRIENLIYGRINNFQIPIFDYVYTTGSGKHYKGHYQTVAMLESNALNLPLFSMRPGGAWQELGQMFGGQDIDFARIRCFSNKYLLRGANEAHIRQTFNPQILSYLEATNGLSFEGGGNRIFAYRHKVLLEPAQFRPIPDEAVKAADLLANKRF